MRQETYSSQTSQAQNPSDSGVRWAWVWLKALSLRYPLDSGFLSCEMSEDVNYELLLFLFCFFNSHINYNMCYLTFKGQIYL